MASKPVLPEEPSPEVLVARPPRAGRIERLDRPSYANKPLEPLPWLAAYRLHVTARSPRLAACFVGAQRPGTLRWSASVEPTRGRVGDQTIEPTLASDALTRQQRDCVFQVLSDPPYELESAGERSTPARVGMVIEF